jgi:hypothetical protein
MDSRRRFGRGLILLPILLYFFVFMLGLFLLVGHDLMLPPCQKQYSQKEALLTQPGFETFQGVRQ